MDVFELGVLRLRIACYSTGKACLAEIVAGVSRTRTCRLLGRKVASFGAEYVHLVNGDMYRSALQITRASPVAWSSRIDRPLSSEQASGGRIMMYTIDIHFSS